MTDKSMKFVYITVISLLTVLFVLAVLGQFTLFNYLVAATGVYSGIVFSDPLSLRGETKRKTRNVAFGLLTASVLAIVFEVYVFISSI